MSSPGFFFSGKRAILASVYKGNSGFQLRGTTARLKTPQDPIGVTGGRMARPQGDGWLTPAEPENAASACLWPRLGAVPLVH